MATQSQLHDGNLQPIEIISNAFEFLHQTSIVIDYLSVISVAGPSILKIEPSCLNLSPTYWQQRDIN